MTESTSISNPSDDSNNRTPKDDSHMTVLIRELHERRKQVLLGGGAKRIAQQHAAGNLSARERVDALLDEDSFQEQYGFARHRCIHFGMEQKELAADGVVTGCGTLNGRLIHLASQDFTVAGGGRPGKSLASRFLSLPTASQPAKRNAEYIRATTATPPQSTWSMTLIPDRTSSNVSNSARHVEVEK